MVLIILFMYFFFFTSMRWLMPISISEFNVYYVTNKRGLVAQWITRLPTEQKIPGSSPGKVDISFFFLLHLFLW